MVGDPGTDAFRCDHLFALPKLSDVKTVVRMFRGIAIEPQRTQNASTCPASATIKYFIPPLGVMKAQVWAFLFVIAQSRKFQRITNFSVLLINDAGNEPMGNLVAFNRETDLKIFLLPHGMNIIRYAFLSPAVDHTHITYLAYGRDHQDFYRVYLNKDVPMKTDWLEIR